MDMSKSKNIVEGDTLHLECWVKGYPRANVTWLKDNQTLHIDNKRITIEAKPAYDQLEIKSTSSADNGVYMCVAVDSEGRSSSKSIVVRVKGWYWYICIL
jgi:hypothetical protein